MENEKEIYLKAYREGFESALKMAWSYVLEARQELYSDDSNAKGILEKLEEKIKK